MIGLLRELLIELVERQPRPERLFEFVGAAAKRAQHKPFADDDGPRPHRRQHQHDHHRLDERIGPHEQRDDGNAVHVRTRRTARLGGVDIRRRSRRRCA
jgi:hypothetical protein